MLELANLLLIGASAVLLLLTVTARPVKPESFMGFHVITIPLALAMTLALAVGVAAAWQSTVLPAWPLYAALPAYLVTLVVLPYECFSRHGALRAKLLVVIMIAGTALAMNGALLNPRLQLAGGITILGLAGTAYAILGYSWLGRKLRRFFLVRANRGVPDDFQVQLGKQQRERWLQLPRDADLPQLLQFTRSYDPEVKAQCLARIRDLPERDSLLLALLPTQHAEDALHYITHEYPTKRHPIAAGIAQALDTEHAQWVRLIQAKQHPDSSKRPIMHLLECGTAVMMDGGDVKAQMQRWQQLLAGIESMAGLAKEMQRYIKKAR